MKTFILIATLLAGPAPAPDLVLEYGVTRADCVALAGDISTAESVELAPGIVAPMAAIALTCEALPPCQFEDSDNCFWDGATRGNRRGKSFLAIGGRVHFVESVQ